MKGRTWLDRQLVDAAITQQQKESELASLPKRVRKLEKQLSKLIKGEQK